LFEPFFTTKDLGKGTGLGLSAVHGTMRSHHGAIAVHSREGHGTRFELYFEASANAREVPRALPERAASPRLAARVVLADDEPLVRSTLRELLEEAGCDVTAVASGEALLETLALRPMPDVIVTDLAMPGLDGIKLVQTLEATCPGCPILLITGFSGQDISSAFTGQSRHVLLRKPFTADELLTAMQGLLGGAAVRRRSSWPPSIAVRRP
jgi:two-component system, cell cycle sensor histidine kinase and response regulator CckA